MENMQIYNAARTVPEEAQKPYTNGRFSGTDINPMWRIKTLTELFGPVGVGWYYEVTSERAETVGDTVMAIVDLNLYINPDGKGWSKPIFGTGGNVLLSKGRPSDEGYKMALTDALSVACKALGIGADIYFARDKTKYTEAQEQQTKVIFVGREPRDEPKPAAAAETPPPVCDECGRPILAYRDSKGAWIRVEAHCKRSLDRFSRVLCLDCIQKGIGDRR